VRRLDLHICDKVRVVGVAGGPDVRRMGAESHEELLYLGTLFMVLRRLCAHRGDRLHSVHNCGVGSLPGNRGRRDHRVRSLADRLYNRVCFMELIHIRILFVLYEWRDGVPVDGRNGDDAGVRVTDWRDVGNAPVVEAYARRIR
jgi:hypothetical protein